MTNKPIQQIEVLPYNPEWPNQYEIEATKIKEALGSNLIEIHHVGSTSIPGLAAKPILDILLTLHDTKFAIKALELIGFEFRSEYNVPFRLFFRNDEVKIPIKLHSFPAQHGHAELMLCFRNYLRNHPDIMNEYQNLKLNLVGDDSSFERGLGGFLNYTLRKNDFIKSVLKKAGFHGIVMNLCLHESEWTSAKNFRQKYFFDKILIKDPYEWTFDRPDHKHLVLYSGVRIVGYAHVQLWPESRSIIRIIVIDESTRNLGLGSQFLQLIEKWLKSTGVKTIHADSNKQALSFYKHHEYREMPLNDPDGYESDPEDISVGKSL